MRLGRTGEINTRLRFLPSMKDDLCFQQISATACAYTLGFLLNEVWIQTARPDHGLDHSPRKATRYITQIDVFKLRGRNKRKEVTGGHLAVMQKGVKRD